MNLLFLLKLSENDKRVIIAIALVIIIIFVIIGLLGSLTVKIMKWQGKKCDTLVSDVVTYRIIRTPSELRKYARRKNTRHFIKQAWIPVIILLVGALTLIIRNSIANNWAYNPFNLNDGFGTLLWWWDFSTIGVKLENWKPVITWPQMIHWPLKDGFNPACLPSYIIVTCLVVGGGWYFVIAQAYLARTIRAHILAKKVFEKSLDDFDQSKPMPKTDLLEQK